MQNQGKREITFDTQLKTAQFIPSESAIFSHTIPEGFVPSALVSPGCTNARGIRTK